MAKETGQRVKAWRETTKISQRQLAEILDVSQSYVGNIEAGRTAPSRNFLMRLQEKFGVRADFILYGDGPPVFAEVKSMAQEPKHGTDDVDQLVLMICAAAVTREFDRAGVPLSPETLFQEAIAAYQALMARLQDPEDGDAIEATMPEISASIAARLTGYKTSAEPND